MMVEAQFIVDLVHKALPQAEVRPTDFTGGGDHWHVVVVDPSFEGLRAFKRQRIVMEPFKPHIATNEVHALDLVCLTPKEQEQREKEAKEAPSGAEATGLR